MMVDWFVLLFIAYILIMTVLEELASHSRLTPYFKQTGSLGIRKSVTFFLVRSMTPGTLLLTIWLILHQGLFGGISLAMIGIISMFLFSKIYLFVQKRGQMHTGTLKFFSFIVSLGNLLLEGVIAAYIFQHVFHLLPLIPLFIIGILLFLFTTLGGYPSLQRFSVILLIFIFLINGTLPIGYYLFGGISTVYGTLKDLGDILHIQLNLIDTILIGIPIFLSQLIHQYSFWENKEAINPDKSRLIFQIVTICWFSVPLGFTALALFFISMNPSHHGTLSIFSAMIGQTPSFIMYLFIFMWLALTLISMSHNLHNLTQFINDWLHLFIKRNDQFWIRFIYIVGFVLITFLIVTAISLVTYFQAIIDYSLITLASLFIPTLFTILSAKRLKWLPVMLAMGLFGLGMTLLVPYQIETVLVIVIGISLFIWILFIHFIQSDFSEYS